MPYTFSELDAWLNPGTKLIEVRRLHFEVPLHHQRGINKKKLLLSYETVRTLTRAEAGALIAELAGILVLAADLGDATGLGDVETSVEVDGLGVLTRLEVVGLINQLASALVH